MREAELAELRRLLDRYLAPDGRAATGRRARATALHPRMRWWGWGEDGHDAPLAPGAPALLGAELGALPARPTRSRSTTCGCRSRGCRRPRASGSRRSSAPSTCATTASRACSTPPGAATTTSCGCAPATPSGAPDAVAYPADADEVAALLRACAEHQVAVVPFGGGTSVVGGVEPLRGRSPRC